MTQPRIAITTYGRSGKVGFSLPAEYVDAVRRAGGVPLLLPPGEEELDAWLSIAHGLVLAGGGDLDPRRYGGHHHEQIYMVDEERDRSELALARRALELGVPTLAICRGAQVVNVVLGGTLHEHLPDVVGEEVEHRRPPREPTPHPVRILGGSLLAGILGRTEIEGESWHHQSIKEMAPQLYPVAHAPDGVVEAVEMRGHPWFLGLQWHPELSAARDPAQQQIFDALVVAARRRTSREPDPPRTPGGTEER